MIFCFFNFGHLHLLMKSSLTKNYSPEKINIMHAVVRNGHLNKHRVGYFLNLFSTRNNLYTPPKFNIAPEKIGGWKMILSYWEGNFSRANC